MRGAEIDVLVADDEALHEIVPDDNRVGKAGRGAGVRQADGDLADHPVGNEDVETGRQPVIDEDRVQQRHVRREGEHADVK